MVASDGRSVHTTSSVSPQHIFSFCDPLWACVLEDYQYDMKWDTATSFSRMTWDSRATMFSNHTREGLLEGRHEEEDENNEALVYDGDGHRVTADGQHDDFDESKLDRIKEEEEMLIEVGARQVEATKEMPKKDNAQPRQVATAKPPLSPKPKPRQVTTVKSPLPPVPQPLPTAQKTSRKADAPPPQQPQPKRITPGMKTDNVQKALSSNQTTQSKPRNSKKRRPKRTANRPAVEPNSSDAVVNYFLGEEDDGSTRHQNRAKTSFRRRHRLRYGKPGAKSESDGSSSTADESNTSQPTQEETQQPLLVPVASTVAKTATVAAKQHVSNKPKTKQASPVTEPEITKDVSSAKIQVAPATKNSNDKPIQAPAPKSALAPATTQAPAIPQTRMPQKVGPISTSAPVQPQARIVVPASAATMTPPTFAPSAPSPASMPVRTSTPAISATPTMAAAAAEKHSPPRSPPATVPLKAISATPTMAAAEKRSSSRLPPTTVISKPERVPEPNAAKQHTKIRQVVGAKRSQAREPKLPDQVSANKHIVEEKSKRVHATEVPKQANTANQVPVVTKSRQAEQPKVAKQDTLSRQAVKDNRAVSIVKTHPAKVVSKVVSKPIAIVTDTADSTTVGKNPKKSKVIKHNDTVATKVVCEHVHPREASASTYTSVQQSVVQEVVDTYIPLPNPAPEKVDDGTALTNVVDVQEKVHQLQNVEHGSPSSMHKNGQIDICNLIDLDDIEEPPSPKVSLEVIDLTEFDVDDATHAESPSCDRQPKNDTSAKELNLSRELNVVSPSFSRGEPKESAEYMQWWKKDANMPTEPTKSYEHKAILENNSTATKSTYRSKIPPVDGDSTTWRSTISKVQTSISETLQSSSINENRHAHTNQRKQWSSADSISSSIVSEVTMTSDNSSPNMKSDINTRLQAIRARRHELVRKREEQLGRLSSSRSDLSSLRSPETMRSNDDRVSVARELFDKESYENRQSSRNQ